MHFSHVGANTGRDHFSGWSLDWVNLALGYLPFLHRFYAPADARAAFIAVRDAAAHYGGHIVAIPRDTLPVLTKQGSSDPLWQADEPWTPVTPMRIAAGREDRDSGARRARPTSLHPPARRRPPPACRPTSTSSTASRSRRFPRRPGVALHARADDRRRVDRHAGLRPARLRRPRGVDARRAPASSLHHSASSIRSIAPSETFVEVWEHFGISEKHLLDVLLEKP